MGRLTHGMTYEKLPIVDAARRCGLMLDARTLRREEVEAACPFCGLTTGQGNTI